jgi:large subunit ribosomal protein L13
MGNVEPGKTWMANNHEIDRHWWIVDASHLRLGRVATEVAKLLRGKHKPTFTPHVDTGDFVVVINTDKLELTGTKWEDKTYYRHSRFFGSLKEKTAAQWKKQDSCFLMSEAVRGMLPDNRMSFALLKKLKTFKGAEHDHVAQKPKPFKVETMKKATSARRETKADAGKKG